ncbi:transglycosylase domain-containing protein [Desulfofalx alkaliphila]|uniref:transglycosylase domain-containing protein n=1 Tax=Desulfofalx alkaliphila TaxID=105483 RepID=UPI000B1D2A92|nr:PBP1A family penicillin-binding protein [Desulfofalx alkaliphila]
MTKKTRRRRKLNVLRFALVTVIFFAMVIGAAGLAFVYSSVADMPAFSPSDINFAASTEIYDKDDNLVARVGIENRTPVDIKDVPEMVKNAFIAIEDTRFYSHRGVDIYRIFGAAWADLKTGSLDQGASTITQQLARQSSVTNIGTEKKFRRKVQEMFLAIQIERHLTKDEILQEYLNGIYFGEGAHGIQAASIVYFNKNVDQLTLEEAALLAGLPQAPSAYNPYHNEEVAKNRRNIVLDQMAKHGYITEQEAQEAKNTEITLSSGKLNTATAYPYPYFVDHVTELLIATHGENEVFRKGLRVYTTLDPKIQSAAEEALANENRFPNSSRDEQGNLLPYAAAVVLDVKNGHVKALVGGREHLASRGWNRATDEKRQPGSTFKPIAAYGPAIEYIGKGPASIYDDIPTTFGGSYTPRNYGGSYRGLITMRQAITVSANLAAVKALQEAGIGNATKFVSALGLADENNQLEGLSAALGGIRHGVTPLQLAAAYGAFANDGIYSEPVVIRRVERLDGTVLEENTAQQHRAMKSTTAFLITDMLRSAVVGPGATGGAASLPQRDVAGKTGTTDDSTDVWFAGYTTDFVAVTWIGSKSQRQSLPSGYSSGTTASLWRDIMIKAHEGLPERRFSGPPPGIVRATVDNKSGLLPGPHTPDEHMTTDYFVQGTVPTETDSSHVLMEVCADNGLLPNEYCPNRITKVLIKLPYTVDSRVQDYHLRAPTEMCDLHNESNSGGWLPDFPDFDDPWAPPKNDDELQDGHRDRDSDEEDD